MTRHGQLCLQIILIASLVGCASSGRQTRTPVYSSPDLEFTAFLDDSVYLTGQPIYVFLKVRNTSKSMVRDMNSLRHCRGGHLRLFRADDSTEILSEMSCAMSFLSKEGLPLQPGTVDCEGMNLLNFFNSRDPGTATRDRLSRRSIGQKDTSLTDYLNMPRLEPGRYRVEARYNVHSGYRLEEQVTLLIAPPMYFQVRPIESDPSEHARVVDFLGSAPGPHEERKNYCLRRLRGFRGSRYFLPIFQGTGTRIKSTPVDTLLTWYREVAANDAKRATLLAYVRWLVPDLLKTQPGVSSLIQEFAFWERSRTILAAWRNHETRTALRERLMESRDDPFRSPTADLEDP